MFGNSSRIRAEATTTTTVRDRTDGKMEPSTRLNESLLSNEEYMADDTQKRGERQPPNSRSARPASSRLSKPSQKFFKERVFDEGLGATKPAQKSVRFQSKSSFWSPTTLALTSVAAYGLYSYFTADRSYTRTESLCSATGSIATLPWTVARTAVPIAWNTGWWVGSTVLSGIGTMTGLNSSKASIATSVATSVGTAAGMGSTIGSGIGSGIGTSIESSVGTGIVDTAIGSLS